VNASREEMIVKRIDWQFKEISASLMSNRMLPSVLFSLLVASSCCSGLSPSHGPPDIVGSTRIEIHYPEAAIGYFFPSSGIEESIFTLEEREYVHSLETWVVGNRDSIRRFARDLGQGTYSGEQRGVPKSFGVHITCYRDGEKLASFTVYGGGVVVTDDRVRFKYQPGMPNLTVLEPPGIQRFKVRWQCALKMVRLYVAGPLLRSKVGSYPDANHWCDVVVEALRSQYFTYAGWGDRKERTYGDLDIARMFTCPSAPGLAARKEPRPQPSDANLPNQTVGKWQSQYALNPHCMPNSPEDTVLLFETKVGWNQHGGSELFTFENHDPKGGLVLLNDGTAKFIRTEEELKQLRWK
jgi:hypothetical protein